MEDGEFDGYVGKWLDFVPEWEDSEAAWFDWLILAVGCLCALLFLLSVASLIVACIAWFFCS